MLNEDLLMFESSSDSDSELEDALLLEIFGEQNVIEYRAQLYGHFELDNYTENECKLYFRFGKNDIRTLAEALRLANHFHTDSNHRASGVEGLCILLRRLSYPNRLVDLEPFFGRSASALSKIISYGHLPFTSFYFY